MAGAVALAYAPVLYWMWGLWRPSDPYSTGGLLIPLISLYLVWNRRARLRDLIPAGSNWGLAVMGLGAGMYLLGSWTGVHYAYACSLIILIWGLILWLSGKQIARKLLFPVAFLVFMIPLNWVVDVLTMPLRLTAAQMAAWLPRALGLPTTVDGTDVIVEGYSLLIDLPCSGLRSLLALLAASALLAYHLKAPAWRKLALGMSALPVAVLGNVARIDATLLMGKAFGPKAAEGFFHGLSGIVIFGCELLCLYYLRRFLCPPAPADG